MQNKYSVKEYAICNIILTVVGAGYVLAGASAIALFILIPALLTYMFVRFDLKRTFLPIILTFAVPSIVTSSINIMPLLIALPMSIMLSVSIKRRRGLLYSVSLGVAGQIISALAIITVLGLILQTPPGTDIVEQFNALLDETMNSVMEAYKFPSYYKSMFYDMFIGLLPAVIVSFMAATSYFVFYTSTRLLKRRDISYGKVHRPFSELKVDKMCILAVAIFFIISLFADGALSRALVNIVIILMFFIFVCGLSVMVFFVKRIHSRIARIFIYILLGVMFFVTSSMFAIVGFIDAFADIRRLNKK